MGLKRDRTMIFKQIQGPYICFLKSFAFSFLQKTKLVNLEASLAKQKWVYLFAPFCMRAVTNLAPWLLQIEDLYEPPVH